jgi:hypothetical protein
MFSLSFFSLATRCDLALVFVSGLIYQGLAGNMPDHRRVSTCLLVHD